MDLILVACLNILVALGWRRSLTGPDEGVWLLWAMSDTPYNRLIDPKPPGIHLWLKGLSLIVGKRIEWIKFLHHLGIGALIVYATYLTGNVWTGIAATAIVQSVYLWAYQSWVDAISGALLLVAITSTQPIMVVAFAVAAIGCNIKTFVPVFLFLLWSGAYVEVATVSFLVVVGAIVVRQLFPAVWYNTIVIPKRMTKNRREFPPVWELMPSQIVASLPVIILFFLSVDAPAGAWLAAICFVLFSMIGGVFQPNHMLPLVFLAAWAGPLSIVLLIIEVVVSGLWRREPWSVTYPMIVPALTSSKAVAKRIADFEGDVWVNSMHTEIYALSQKPMPWGMSEVIEAARVVTEKRDIRDMLLNASMPPTIVLGPYGAKGEKLSGYTELERIGPFIILRGL